MLIHIHAYYVQESAPMAINWNDHEGRGALHLAVADGTEAAVRVLVRCYMFRSSLARIR